MATIWGDISSGARTVRLATLALVIVLSLWASFTTRPPNPVLSAAEEISEDRGDVALYREVARRVAAGESYYTAAAEQHRARNYPLKPFYTVRLPTLAWVAALAGNTALTVAAWIALLAALAAWYRRLRERPFGERLAALGLLTFTGAPLISAQAVMMHEFWCGMLLTIALALDPRREWPGQLALATLAFAVREFAAAFLMLMLAAAAFDRDKRRFAAIAAVMIGCTALLLLHREMVMAVVVPADPSSASWIGLRGPGAVVDDLRAFSWLGLVPSPLAAFVVFAALLGWSTLERGAGFALLWFIGFGFVVSAFARPDNFYWAVVMLPAYPVGLAFLWSFIRGQEARGSLSSTSNPPRSSLSPSSTSPP